MPPKETHVPLSYVPRKWQRACHLGIFSRQFSVVVCHRRAGKSLAMILHLIDCAIALSIKGREHAPGRFAFIAPELQQAKSNCWGYLRHYAGKIPGVILNASENSATLPNGTSIRLYGASEPDSLRGAYLDGVILDEVAQLPEDLWQSVIYPQLTDYKGFAVFCGTANGINLLSKTYYAALNKPDRWFTAFYTVNDTDVFTPAQIAQMQEDMDPAKFNREYLCDFSAATDNVMMSFDDCRRAADRHATPDQFQFAPIILGIDIARQGADRSACVLRQGLFMDKPWIWKIADTMELAARIAVIIQERKPDAVFIDGSGGYGAGVIDRLRSLNTDVIEVQFGGKADGPEYVNKRSEMWGRLAEWVKKTGHIPNIPEVFQDLCGPTYKHDAKDRIMLESKEDMKKRDLPSPDCFVAGTMIDTPNGKIPIELLGVGDIVCTPFGPSVIIKTWESEAQSITTVHFSNGSQLSGKGAHKIFTWEQGITRLDELSLSFTIDTSSRRWLWRIVRLFTTRERNSEFKPLVDTISCTGRRLARSDFFTAVFGLTTRALSRKVTIFITLMVIGAITTLRICSALIDHLIGANICMNDYKIQRIVSRSMITSSGQDWLLQHGTQVQKDGHGIRHMQKNPGKHAPCYPLHALSAENLSKHYARLKPNIAQVLACKKMLRRVIGICLGLASGAISHLWHIVTGQHPVAVTSVQTENVQPSRSLLVYNLTLARHNAYYANGVLVFNCGDACALTFAYHVAQKRLHHFGILGQAEENIGGKIISEYDPLDAIR